jgi:hypothetical protein
LNEARDEVGHRDDFNGTAKQYGEAVHKEFTKLVEAKNLERIKNPSNPKPAIFITEKTFSRSGEEKDRKRNSPDSKRIDALQRRGINACVYEATTGEGIDHGDMLAIVYNMAKDDSMKGVTTYIVTRVRPSTPPPPPKRTR